MEGLSWSDEMKEFEKAARRAPFGDAEAYGRTIDTVEEDSDELEDILDDLVKVTVGVEDKGDEGESEDDIYV